MPMRSVLDFLSRSLGQFLGLGFLLCVSPALAEADAAVLEPTDYFGQIVISLVLVLLIIFVSAWMLRRFGRFPGVADGQLKVLGALSVGQRERILLLQVGDEQILVGVTSSRISTLHHLNSPVEIPENAKSLSGSFAEKLTAAMQKTSSPKND